MVFTSMMPQTSPNPSGSRPKQTLRAITSATACRSSPVATPKSNTDMNRNQEVGFFTDFSPYGQEEPLALEINMRNLENLTLLDNLTAVNGIPGIENNENIAFFQDYDGPCNGHFLPDDDTKEPNVSRTVRVPSSEHVAEIVGRQGCKIKDLRARTNTYIKTPMRTESPVFVVTGKETAVNLVISEINSAAEHFTQIRASRNHHKNAGGGGGGTPGTGTNGEVAKPATREGDVVLHVTVPYRVVGLVVGLKGQTIKQIQQDTDTFIVTPNRDKAPIFEIRGQPSNVERARVMIERHIEVRTRNCRLQDTTNLQNCDEPRFGTNDYHYNYTETSSPPNGNSNHLSNNYISNSNSYNSLNSPNYNLCSPHSSSTGNYNSWRSYSGLLEPGSTSQSAPIQTWSSATSEYGNVIGNGHSNCSMRSNGGGMQYNTNMSVGSMSSNSNGSVSASPPQDFLSSGTFSNNRQVQGSMPGSGNNRSGVDPSCDGPSSFSSFSMMSTSSTTPTKGSLVLGNLGQQSANMNGSSVVGSREMTNGFGGRSTHDGMGFSTSSSVDFFRGGFSGDHAIFGQMGSSDVNGFPSGESSPASKSCSLSESSGSQGSPTPRMCKVCEEADVVAALVPCGHNHFCMECADSIIHKPTEMDRKCPICSALAVNVLRILA